MSNRSDIKDNLVTTLEDISGMRTVSTKFKLIGDVLKSQMPYTQIISTPEDREAVSVQKASNCFWDIDIWLYVPDEDDVETWIETIRIALYVDRSRGSANVLNTELTKVITDPVGIVAPRGLAILTVQVKFREGD